MITESDEVAAAMPLPPASYSYSDCLRQVRMQMRDESETVISNVAWSLYCRLYDQAREESRHAAA